ncbi:hypothetical protein E2C01_030959 [Portunus trituberculatus]|uniref:Uncharacterized protein n=1 Tax=Portunus trituberculatus TaxID=210409 RepID=A0A5B7EWS7_PORTR|nr:hypothetical protein [Portunus trituberculatus]
MKRRQSRRVVGGVWRNEEQLVTFMTSLSRPIRLPGLAKHEDHPHSAHTRPGPPTLQLLPVYSLPEPVTHKPFNFIRIFHPLSTRSTHRLTHPLLGDTSSS